MTIKHSLYGLLLCLLLVSCAGTQLKPDQGIAMAQALRLPQYVTAQVDGQAVSGALWYDSNYSPNSPAFVFYYPSVTYKGKFCKGGCVPFAGATQAEALAQVAGYIPGYEYASRSLRLAPTPAAAVALTSPDYCELAAQRDKARDTALGIRGHISHGIGEGHAYWVRDTEN